MKFMLLIGGSDEAWGRLSESDWAESVDTHKQLIAELGASGEFIECDELNVKPDGARVVRTKDGSTTAEDGPLQAGGNFASGYYLVQCADIERAGEIAARLYESRFAPIEVRQVGS